MRIHCPRHAWPCWQCHSYAHNHKAHDQCIFVGIVLGNFQLLRPTSQRFRKSSTRQNRKMTVFDLFWTVFDSKLSLRSSCAKIRPIKLQDRLIGEIPENKNLLTIIPEWFEQSDIKPSRLYCCSTPSACGLLSLIANLSDQLNHHALLAVAMHCSSVN